MFFWKFKTPKFPSDIIWPLKTLDKKFQELLQEARWFSIEICSFISLHVGVWGVRAGTRVFQILISKLSSSKYYWGHISGCFEPSCQSLTHKLILKFICLNCKVYIYFQSWNIFVWILKHICLKSKIYFFKSWIVFVWMLKCIDLN